jgi:CRP-like cAMP-binding protein
MLEQIIPFRYLTPTQRQALLADATEEVHGPGTVLIEQGDRKDSRVFLLLEGSVRVRDPNEAEPGHTKVITAGHYIGERAALFDEPRSLEARAIGRTRVLCIPGDRFLRLVHESTGFAQALGGILRSKQAIFQSFTRFRVALLPRERWIWNACFLSTRRFSRRCTRVSRLPTRWT